MALAWDFSVADFRLARPTSKSFPTMASMLKKMCITFAIYGDGPYIAQVTVVVSPMVLA